MEEEEEEEGEGEDEVSDEGEMDDVELEMVADASVVAAAAAAVDEVGCWVVAADVAMRPGWCRWWSASRRSNVDSASVSAATASADMPKPLSLG